VIYIVLGLCAYPALAAFEYASLRGIGALKTLMGLVTVVLPTVSFWAILRHPEKFSAPVELVWLGVVLTVLSVGLWLYSMFFEIPFNETYVQAGHGDRLITHGTYALTRHPAVLWFGLMMLGLVLVTRSSLLRVGAPLWWLADVLYVWAEEKWFLSRVFPEYEVYQSTTPMLWPTRRSVRRFLRRIRYQADGSEV
jgi:protein-S-isoprenylcysteine O-methyltransferase Ste14